MPDPIVFPDTEVLAPIVGGVAAANLIFSGDVYVKDMDGQDVTITDVWVERIIDALDAEATYGKEHPFSRPTWATITLTETTPGVSDESRFYLRPSIDPTGPGAVEEWKYVELGFTASDGELTADGKVWIVSPEFEAPVVL